MSQRSFFARVTREGKHWLAEFPDAPGCQTFADSREELAVAAREAIEGWLEAHLERGRVPPRPKAHRGDGILVDIDPRLQWALVLRWERTDRGLTQGDLAQLAGVTQQHIAKLESPNANPSIETMEKIAAAFHALPFVSFVPMANERVRK